MNEMRNSWLIRKHDILAGSFATMSMVFVLQLLFGNSASDIPPVVVAQTSPPAFGVMTDVPDAPDTLAQAGETRKQADPTVDDEQDDANEEIEPNSDDSERTDETSELVENDTDASEQLAENQHSTTADPERGDANNSDGTTSEDDNASAGQVANAVSSNADKQLKPNPVESAPKPLEQMSAEELQAAVEAYEEWVHKGDIKLLLDYSRLSVNQLNSIVQLYVASTRHHTLWITPDGSLKDIEEATAPAGKLIGDLPLDRNKWPPELVQRARERFGKSFVAKANFLLTDAAAVTLYRTLAQAVGNEQPKAGTQVMLRLQPNERQIEVQLVGYK